MKYISLPTCEEHSPTSGGGLRLSFYLAMEEYVARYIDDDDLFFMWQVPPTVIFGRNQLIENEVNVDYCRKHGIQMYRRKSGGGCVYADQSNVMFSYVTKDENVNLTFSRYINMVVLVLRKLGVDAHSTGRNDVMIGDRKVSGNAFYHIPGRSIVHGTMLYDTCMEHMVGAITPDDAKLLTKGVESVRQHIALLKDYITLSLDEFMAFVRKNLCQEELELSADALVKIAEIEREYLSKSFIFGNNPRYTVVRRGRIAGVGQLEARLQLKNNIIKSLNLVGDYFLVGELDALLSHLKGVALTRESLDAALPARIDNVVRHLERDDFINLLIQ
mgnify:CR=1 FL=1